MKLANADWTNTLSWDALHPGSLVLEHPNLFLQVVSDLTEQMDGEEGKLIFSTGLDQISLAKDALLIRDLWSVDVNQKKLLNGVLAKLKSLAREEYEVEIQHILSKLNQLMEGILQTSMLPLVWDDTPDVQTIFKVMGLQLENVEDPVERLVDYVRLAQEFLHTKLVVLVGARGFLTYDCASALCEDFRSAELPVLFVDGTVYPLLPGEKRLLIDSDYCELLLP